MNEILQKLCNCNSASGNEQKIRQVIAEISTPYADEVFEDALGNLVIHKKGNGKKVMLCAHMDEIGFIVTGADDNGFLHFAPVGGLSLSSVIDRCVIFDNGIRGIIHYEEKVKKEELKLKNCYIDIGAQSKKIAMDMAPVGTTAVFDEYLHEDERRYFGKALDDRAGCYVLLEVLRRATDIAYDIYFVFTTQEEIGLRGAQTSAFSIQPDIGLCVDVTSTGDIPECEIMEVALGKGPAIKIKDAGIICHKSIRNWLISAAKDLKLAYQLEILAGGSTDAGAVHLTRGGVMTGAISIPCRYIHSACECADKTDIEQCIELILKALKCEI